MTWHWGTRSGVQGLTQVHSEFESNLGYMRVSQKNLKGIKRNKEEEDEEKKEEEKKDEEPSRYSILFNQYQSLHQSVPKILKYLPPRQVC